MNNVESPKLMKWNNNCKVKEKKKNFFEKRINTSKSSLKGKFYDFICQLM